MKKFAIIALAAATFLAGIAPASAFPTVSAKAPSVSVVEQVQYRDNDRRDRRDWRENRRDHHRHWRDDRRDDRRGWYRGHRGYRDSRPGYRRHSDGYWYPLAALGLGAVIGTTVIAQPPRVIPQAGINPRHVEWCSVKYRSYRSYDNTYQPVGAARQQCMSPYY